MSKIGKLPIHVKEGITVTIAGDVVNVSGPKGQLSYTLPKGITADVSNGQLTVSPKRPDPSLAAFWGLARAQLANMVKGVDTGFERKLELHGVGYRAQMQGNDLVLTLGFSHPVKVTPREGVTLSVSDNVISVSGIDKMLVGDVAAKIRAIKPPEPYKGKGIRYVGEQVRRKAGKATKAIGGK